MAKVTVTKQRTMVGNVTVESRGGVQTEDTKQYRIGHEVALPVTLPDGTKIHQTRSGRKFKTRKI